MKFEKIIFVIFLSISVLAMCTLSLSSVLSCSASRTHYGLEFVSSRNVQAPQTPSRLQWTLWAGFGWKYSICSDEIQGEWAKSMIMCTMRRKRWEAL